MRFGLGVQRVHVACDRYTGRGGVRPCRTSCVRASASDEMFLLVQRLLKQRDAAVEQFHRPEVMERHVRIGVTELTAMTWLPRLIGAIQYR